MCGVGPYRTVRVINLSLFYNSFVRHIDQVATLPVREACLVSSQL